MREGSGPSPLTSSTTAKQLPQRSLRMTLPMEVVQHIFSFLGPREILRLRQISKQFGDITRSDILWREIYANARLKLLLPPGPFSWQSTEYLERTLVQSELLSKTWSSQPLKARSYISTSLKREDDFSWIVAFGRWCVYLEEKVIRCHDIENDIHHVLYDGTSHPNFRFAACATTDIKGDWVYLFLADHRNTHELLRLLVFRVNNHGFSEPEIMDLVGVNIPPGTIWQLSPDKHHFCGSTPFLVFRLYSPTLIFDTRTRSFNALPPFYKNSMDGLRIGPDFMSTRIIPTRTHIIVIRSSEWAMKDPVLIYAFVVPDLATPRDRNKVGVLCLTHKASVHIPHEYFSLLRNSVFDPATRSDNIRLLQVIGYGQQREMSCIDLTLPERLSTTDVLPISVRSQHLFKSTWYLEQCTTSDDGHVRGILLLRSTSPSIGPSSARKFSIDASGPEECTVTLGDPYPIGLSNGDGTLDGIQGRIHYLQNTDTERQVVTADLV